MRLLLDTQIVVWSLLKTRELPSRALALMSEPEVEQVVSTVTVWEIAIKHARHGPKVMPLSGKEVMQTVIERETTLLAITPRHAAAIDDLPPIHGDPFDRMLVAQALTEPTRLLTSDATLAQYSDTVILV